MLTQDIYEVIKFAIVCNELLQNTGSTIFMIIQFFYLPYCQIATFGAVLGMYNMLLSYLHAHILPGFCSRSTLFCSFPAISTADCSGPSSKVTLAIFNEHEHSYKCNASNFYMFIIMHGKYMYPITVHCHE